jgi:Lrp/AsnC family leucine-responsive transcriptional regulator
MSFDQTPADLDATDRMLLMALQADGRRTVGDLADQVALSASPCWRRIKQLESSGLIAGYHAHLDRHKLGFGVLGFVQLALNEHTPEATAAFEREVQALEPVLSCHNVSGRFDYQLEVVAPSLEVFSDFVRNAVRRLPGVRELSTSFSMKEVKRTFALPVHAHPQPR